MFRTIIEPNAHGVNAIGRALVRPQFDIGGRPAEFMAALVAVDHAALDRERAGQQMRRGAGVAGLERLTDPAGGHRDPIQRHGPDRLGRDAMFRTKRAQHRRIAAAPFPEGEVLARHHPRRTDPLGQQFGHEILRRRCGQRGVELEHQHGVRPCRGEQTLPLVEAGQAERKRVGAEMTYRMRIERCRDHRPSLVRTALHRASDHRLMTEVKSVEIAERDDRAAQGIGDRPVEGQALHVAGWLNVNQLQVQTLDSAARQT